jgi:hypothetical protein
MHGSLTCEFLDQTRYFYLQELSEPGDNSLRIRCEQCVLSRITSFAAS